MQFSPRVSKVFHKLFPCFGVEKDSSSRILIHGMNFAPEVIGVGKYTGELAQFLAGRRHAVEVVAALPHYPAWTVHADYPMRYRTTFEDGIRVTRCPLAARKGGTLWRLVAPLSFALTAAPVVLWRSLRFRPQVVVCVEPTLFAAPAALFAAKLVGARAVLHVQDLEIDAAFATGHLAQPILKHTARAIERFLLRRFDAVVTISNAMASRLRGFGLDADRVTVLRNWVDPERLTPQAPASVVRASLGVPDGIRLVLYAGNLGAKQGLPILVEAARHLRSHADIRFLIAGDGPMRPVLRAAAASLANLTLVGVQPPERLGALLMAADVHVLPQERAASDLVFPSKLGPLLASGKPIVVTADRSSELGTWLGDAATVVHPGDGRALADALLRECRRDPVQDQVRAKQLVVSLDADSILPAFERLLLPVGSLKAETGPLSAWPAEPAPAGLAPVL